MLLLGRVTALQFHDDDDNSRKQLSLELEVGYTRQEPNTSCDCAHTYQLVTVDRQWRTPSAELMPGHDAASV